MSLIRRQSCVICPDLPACPICPTGEECQMILQTCESCATYVCRKFSSTPNSSQPSESKSNAGAIAGGVIGGLAAVIIVALLLLWKFYYKPRRERQAEFEKLAVEKHGDLAMPGNKNRMSTETLTSLAPSTFARSSNIIPIAYIPGVTTRAVLNSSDQSASDRSSIATTNYRGSTAVISSAMMTAIQARPNLVDIKAEESTGPQAASGPAQAVQYARAFPAKKRQNAHSITIGKGLQSSFIPEESLDESDNEEPLVNLSGKKEEPMLISVQPKIINLTNLSTTKPASINDSKTDIERGTTPNYSASFKTAKSSSELHDSTLSLTRNDAKTESINPFDAPESSIAVAGDSETNAGATLKDGLLPLGDLNGRGSLFEDRYKD